MKNTIIPSIICFIVLTSSCSRNNSNEKIDRYALVNRHNIVVDEFNPLASLSVGNGNFSFTTDITGLQTFYNEYENGVSLGTMSNWGWHTSPNNNNYKIEETFLFLSVNEKLIPYQHQLNSSPRAIEAVNYFRSNPHRLHLGIIRLVVTKENGEEMVLTDVKSPNHKLNLWNGEITSSFMVENKEIKVKVVSHPAKDMISVIIESPMIKSEKIAVEWLFPYGMPVHTHSGYDFNSPEKHTSKIDLINENSAVISRKLFNDKYYATINWIGNAILTKNGNHRFILKPNKGENSIEFSCLFSNESQSESLPDYNSTFESSSGSWKKFWSEGGAVDFSECTDPRAHELERRTILSQYLTKINGSGNLPPQETGLTFNSWFGKFHLEMIWWHSAHYYNWQRPQYTAKQLNYYSDIYPQSLTFTKEQGYKGVRWPKMVGPDGINSPSSVGSYLIWQQPHYIYLAEQMYQANPTIEVLNKYKYLVFATAEFMADFATYNKETNSYSLAPPLIPAQEHWNKDSTYNPPFELAYWYWGLTISQKWKLRVGDKPDKNWEEVRLKIATPFNSNGLYMGIANAYNSYTDQKNMRDHPMVTGMIGMLPKWDRLENEIMKNTLNVIMENWDWEHTWGWDYPMLAMCATRLNEPETAIDILLKDVQKNTYLINGHNYQDERLRIYLPGNGGLLKAIALMCAGWDGCPTINPGFPKNGKWKVKWENLNPDF